MLDNQRCDRQDLDQLMAQGDSILPHSLQHAAQLQPIRDGPAARRSSGHWPCDALAADHWPVPAGRLEVARAAVDPLPQAGQFCRQGSTLNAEIIVLLPECRNILLLSDDQSSDPAKVSR
jgi:hypothetical protein